MKHPITFYPRREEVFNVITHFAGFVLSIAGLTLLVVYSSLYGTVWHIVSFSIYGSTLVTLYLASTLYHSAKTKRWRKKLNVFDHTAIYLLIAGTYTPFCLVTLNGPLGWTVFGIIWGLTLLGSVLKLFFTGRYNKLSTLSYILSGWVIVIAVKSLYLALPASALFLILFGGVFYTIGALFYLWHKVPYNHAIFHIWVLLGSLAHFFCIFFYVL